MYCCNSFATHFSSKYNLKHCMGILIPSSDTESLSKVGKIAVEVFMQM